MRRDYYVFSLVRIEDEDCRFPDEKVRKKVEDRIQAPFIATSEMNEIVYTMLDLEQHLGEKIHWVTGPTFDHVLKNDGGWLPNPAHRYCTTNLKIRPIIKWAKKENILPFTSQIGYRAGEESRVNKMKKRANENGFLVQKVTFEKHKSGRHEGNNKWEHVEWAKPSFPMVNDRIYREMVNQYWEGKDVRFAELNNCAHCFNCDPMLINLMAHKDQHSKKVVEWASEWEGEEKKYWQYPATYDEILDANPQPDLGFDDFSPCDSGHCGI